MAKTTLTKSAVDAAQPQALPVELRDTVVPGFLCKVTSEQMTGTTMMDKGHPHRWQRCDESA